jgi:DNA-binding MarR family transcriptional regulator
VTEFELLIELAKELSLPDIEPDEVTSQLLADYTGVSWSTADRVLKDKETAGLLTSRKVKLANRRIATAYRKVAQ